MKPEEFIDSAAGLCRKTLEGYYAFYPNKLPPTLPLDWDLVRLISETDRALAELSGAGQLLPNPHLLIRPYLRREAILSSRIEDTHAEMGQLALLEDEMAEETSGEPDVQEVANYVRALETGLRRTGNLPISSRLIRELHTILLSDVRGGEPTKTPGEFRRSQNWIGPPGCNLLEATFIPPPSEEIRRLLGEWEQYVHAESGEPALVKAAWLHYQFEAIHPFLDGNGRIGRLLITLFLCDRKCLSQPLLYLSGFFDETRSDYYRLLLDVSRKGAWREWLEYFLRGIRIQSERALADTRQVLRLHEHYRSRLKEEKRVPQEAARILDHVFANPFISIARYARRMGESYHNAQKGVSFWQRQGLLHEYTGQKRNRVYVARELLDLMSAPPPPLQTEQLPIEKTQAERR
ncbi:MAG: Fic family protein [Opitutales bacterium]